MKFEHLQGVAIRGKISFVGYHLAKPDTASGWSLSKLVTTSHCDPVLFFGPRMVIFSLSLHGSPIIEARTPRVPVSICQNDTFAPSHLPPVANRRYVDKIAWGLLENPAPLDRQVVGSAATRMPRSERGLRRTHIGHIWGTKTYHLAPQGTTVQTPLML